MGKRYYCDYCDRAFTDGAENRKKHLESVHHQKLRKAHYDSFRDAATILKDEMAKKPCRKFQQTGNCEYGSGCKYSHLTPSDIQKLQEQVELEKESQIKLPKIVEVSDEDLNAFLDKVKKESAPPPSVSSVPVLPPVLRNIPHLPPSVIPPNPDDYHKHEVAEWGW